jgi:hypothetical protein
MELNTHLLKGVIPNLARWSEIQIALNICSFQGTVVGMEAKWTGLAYFDPFPDSQGIVGLVTKREDRENVA